MTEDEVVGWHHRLDGHEFEQAPGVGDAVHGVAKRHDRAAEVTDRVCFSSSGFRHIVRFI